MEALRDMNLPPGFGFHPSDAELISHYLKRKVHGQKIEDGLIPEVDIYKHEPWDLPSKCNIPIEDNKWHFFASRDRKYPSGARSNRATRAGYWKSTGKDRAIKKNKRTLGTKKTLVFHEGRPPSGKRTEWIMHEYYIDENECRQANPDMKDAFVLCRVTRRDDWALENDTGVGNRNPHPQHLNNADTSVVIEEKQEDPATSVVVIAEKQEDAAASSGICAGESNPVGTPVSAEQSNDVAPTVFLAHSPNSDSEMQAWIEGMLVDPSNPAVDIGPAGLSLIEQDVSSNLQNPGTVGPKLEPDHPSPGMDPMNYLNINQLLSDLSNDFDTYQAYSMIETDHVVFPNNPEVTRNGELQLQQGNYYAHMSNENADNGIIIRRRNATASSASSSSSPGNLKMQVRVNRMVTSNSETINQTMKYSGNNGHMRSFKQSDATRVTENVSISNQGNLKGIKGAFRSSAAFNILFACVCMIGVLAAVLNGYYRHGISL